MRFNADVIHAVVGLLNISSEVPTNLAYVADKEPQLSRMYLEQVFGKLRKAGVVRAHRGPGGGYTLTRPLEKISLQDVMDVIPSKTRKSRVIPAVMETTERNFFARVRTYAQSYTLADIRDGITPTNPSVAFQHMENALRS